MPKREDEYWASRKEGKGRGLCPFLSSEEVVAWVAEGLLGSPGHRVDMLSKTFTYTGVDVGKRIG